MLLGSFNPVVTHDYKRNGTTTLLATLNTPDETVIGRHTERHRRWEFIAFLDQIKKEVLADRPIHAVKDNYFAYKRQAVMDWLKWIIADGRSTSRRPLASR